MGPGTSLPIVSFILWVWEHLLCADLVQSTWKKRESLPSKSFSLRRGADSEESPCNAGDPGLIPGKIPWRRKWQPTAVFLPGESHGQRSLAGYSPSGHKESDMTK